MNNLTRLVLLTTMVTIMSISTMISNAITNSAKSTTTQELPMNSITSLISKATAIATNQAAIATGPAPTKVVENKPTMIPTSVKVARITQQLYRRSQHGLTEIQAVVLASSLMANESTLSKGRTQVWIRNMNNSIDSAILTISDNTPLGLEITTVEKSEIANWYECLVTADLITREGLEGKYLAMLNEAKPKAYARPATEGITKENRRKRVVKNGVKVSKLAQRTLNFLQKTERTICVPTLELAKEVFKGDKVVVEQFVISGAQHQVDQGNVPSVNEYFFDTRFRVYQGDAHGGNVQASDMARAMVSPYGITLDYDTDKALVVLLAEAKDMIKSKTVDQVLAFLAQKGEVAFIKTCLAGRAPSVKKPWSFVKIANLINRLRAGERPYLDVTVGLDAKCSGPQLGGLMVGDEDMIAACGFSKVEIDDAYMACVTNLQAAGFTFPADSRATIKKPYMGVFYGQGWMAYATEGQYVADPSDDQHDIELLHVLLSYDDNLEQSAKVFHSIVEASFGPRMVALRKAIHGPTCAHWHFEQNGADYVTVMDTCKPTTYFLPDGQLVATSYKVKHTIFGKPTIPMADAPDVTITVRGGETFKFDKLTFKTETEDLFNYARTGFVNFIQSMDGLLARLIITKLERLGASHVDSVHDCFRVSVPDMIDGKLHNAIRFAYNSLFGSVYNNTTAELPMGSDALVLYFEGVNRATKEGMKRSTKLITKKHSQFEYDVQTKTSMRNLHMEGIDMPDLINDIQNDAEGTGNTYYFAK